MTRSVTREQLLRSIGDLRPSERTLLIAIDGCGGAGKTSLARWLAEHLKATVVCSDDFSRPGVPQWDWPRFADQVLSPLLDGRKARYQRYDWGEDALAKWHELHPGGIVIAEGVSISRTELGDPWDLTVWVECPLEVRLARVARRDGIADDSWLGEEEAYVRKQRPDERADYVVLGYDGQ